SGFSRITREVRGRSSTMACMRDIRPNLLSPADATAYTTPRSPSFQESMRTETAKPVRLEDYRPPDWLVETVDLDVALHPTATRVRATLSLKPNPKGDDHAPLAL